MKQIRKRVILLLTAAAMVFSMTACSGKPSEEKIKQALDDGNISIEDAKEKGWIDDAWITANYPPVEASNKVHLFDPFETTYLDGSPASSSLISGKMCLVFFNTADESAMDKLNMLSGISGEMKKTGIPILGVITDEHPEEAREKLKDIDFPILTANDEMHKALSNYSEMLKSGVHFVFTKDGGFYSAWSDTLDKDGILEGAHELSAEE